MKVFCFFLHPFVIFRERKTLFFLLEGKYFLILFLDYHLLSLFFRLCNNMLCYNLINYAITFFHHIYFYRIQSKLLQPQPILVIQQKSERGRGMREVRGLKRLTFRCCNRKGAKHSKIYFKWRTLTLFTHSMMASREKRINNLMKISC